MVWDVIVIGGGPAGLAAAQTLGRVRRRTLVLDSGEPRNAPSPAMHNFLSRDGTPPSELRRIARDELGRYGSVELRHGRVDSVRGGEGGFEARLAGGERIGARRLLLATGLADELPPIPGLRELWGKRVLHCPYCHGHEVADSPLAVLGSTPPRVRMAFLLTRLSPDVVLCPADGDPLDAETRGKLERQGVGVREGEVSAVEAVGEDSIRLRFADGGELERRALFVQSRPVQRSPLAAELGCELLEDGSVLVDEAFRTTVPGVYAAGDLARRASVHWAASAVIAAAAAGATAAGRIDQDLLSEDFGLPLVG